MSGVDVIVCEHRTPSDLARFLDSYAATRGPDDRLQVLRVEPDPAEPLLHDAELGEKNAWIVFHDNIGYNAACNEALRLIGELQPVVALFNADVVLAPGALKACATALLAEPTWGILGPRQVDDRNQLTAAGIVGTRARPTHRAWKRPDVGQASDVIDDCPTVAGSALFIRRELITELTACPDGPGSFLAPTFHYWGETWACYHAIEHGWKCVYYGPVRVRHDWHRASPVGGLGEQRAPADRTLFRQLCARHTIPCD